MELSYKENGSKQLFLGCILAVGQNKKGEYLATMKMIQIATIYCGKKVIQYYTMKKIQTSMFWPICHSEQKKEDYPFRWMQLH